jgi:8-oxo-dGTP pyrophosphatase MutT (NUDIX family)
MTLPILLSPAFKTLQMKHNKKKTAAENGDFVPPKPFPKRFRGEHVNDHVKYRQLNGETDKVYGIILISKANRIALVEGRRANKWSFCKGHSNKDEEPVDCIKREAYEEIGLADSTKLGNIRNDNFKRFVTGYYQIVLVDEEFELNPQDKEEIIQARWFDFNELGDIEKNIDLTYYYKNCK